MRSKTDASSRPASSRRIARNLAEIRGSTALTMTDGDRHTCGLHLDLGHKCRISTGGRKRQQMQDVRSGRSDQRCRTTIGSGPARASALRGEVATISYNFVQQLFVSDMIVDIAPFGRSPAQHRCRSRRRLAALNGRDYDPSPASGGLHPARPWTIPTGQLALASAEASASKPLCRRTAQQEGYPV
jgi:hypothetical protein